MDSPHPRTVEIPNGLPADNNEQTPLDKRVQRLGNVCIIGAGVVLILSLGLFIFRYWSFVNSHPTPIPPGTKMNLPARDWSLHRQTLLLVLSTECKYCTASAPFYRRLAAESTGKTAVVVVAAQPHFQTREYLHKLGISLHDIRQIPPESINIKATPALVLINSDGIVIESWQGQLPRRWEDEVISRIR